MRFVALIALVVAATGQFTCIKPVNPIPAGPPGLCCQQLDEYPILEFLYAGNNYLLTEAEGGETTYNSCENGQHAACCDPVLTEIEKTSNIACVLPESS
ncbi:uncharacterized protein N7483_003527 [Penicillium malachiteum]|uniref:uncharacterized protein n=1 Tax=Penicillium malachiteum TaxID=1324776 RepID=UPI002548A263|nr:uncharacterized protein N7483_003527 [Penicillium malachiteum]KAJ5729019.1 hypothetical protein N7483_003527 [Penicillium malachiteum]